MFGSKKKTPAEPENTSGVSTEHSAEDVNAPLDAQLLVLQRNEFYRDGFRYTIGTLLVLSLALIISILLNGTQWYLNREIKRDYFAVSTEGRLTPLIPMNAPFLTREQLLNWASEAATTAFTMDAGNYVARSNEIAQYFTDDGFAQYAKAMNESGLLGTIKKEALIATAVPLGVPVIFNQAEVDGRYTWRVRVPIRVSYQSSTKGDVQNLMVTMTIVRRPTDRTRFGVGISQFVSRPATTGEIGN